MNEKRIYKGSISSSKLNKTKNIDALAKLNIKLLEIFCLLDSDKDGFISSSKISFSRILVTKQ